MEQNRDALSALDGLTVRHVSDATFLMHLGGQREVTPQVPLRPRAAPGGAPAAHPAAARPAARPSTGGRRVRQRTVDVAGASSVGPPATAVGLPMPGPAAVAPAVRPLRKRESHWARAVRA